MAEDTIDPEEFDPDIREAVQAVVNRYGAPGLEQLITLAEHELVRARAELQKLAE
ncbi:MAG TPA: hypothetical protein VFO98_10680 [Marmoricola sp.]|jgi:hypothetical protein|nr:hypothetical protein [Marmoricola sp.]